MRFIRRPKNDRLLRGVNISRLLVLINTTRTSLRVWTGLVGITYSAYSLLFHPSGKYNSNSNGSVKKERRSAIIIARRGAQVVQMALLSVYQLYENIGFLTDQGVLLLSGDDVNNNIASAAKNFYLTSSRAWMGSVVFSIFSTLLAATATTTTTTTTTTTNCEKKTKKEGEEWWWKDLVVPVGISLPLSVHASFEVGLFGDETVALMGLVVAGLGLRKGWRDTEEEGEEEGEGEGKEE